MVEVPRAEPVSNLMLPAGAESEVGAPAAPAPARAEQPAPEAQETPGQVIYLSMFRRYPFRCFAYFALMLGALIACVAWAILGRPYWALGFFAVALVVLGRFGLWWLRMQKTSLRITNKRCILESGITTRKSLEVLLPEVEDIQVNQTFLNRLFNVGDLLLLNKKGAAHRVLIMAVPSPAQVANLIRQAHPATP
jgi:hypothetical protein